MGPSPSAVLSAAPSAALFGAPSAAPSVAEGANSEDVGLRSAGLLAAAMQRLSPDLLSVEEVPLARITDAPAGIIVGALPVAVRRFGAPFVFGSSRVLATGGSSIAFDIQGPVGALQAFEHNGVDLVLAAGTSPDRAARAVEAMAADNDGWYAMSDQIQLLREGSSSLVAVPMDRYVPVVPDRLALADSGAHHRTVPAWVLTTVITLGFVLLVRVLLDGARLVRLRRVALEVVAADGRPQTTRPVLERRRTDRRSGRIALLDARRDRRRADRRPTTSEIDDHAPAGSADPTERPFDGPGPVED